MIRATYTVQLSRRWSTGWQHRVYETRAPLLAFGRNIYGDLVLWFNGRIIFEVFGDPISREIG
jgi:hypothetical protein